MPIPSDPSRPVARVLIADELYDRLQNMIVWGELTPGTPLTDEALAERFGASRTPVREALNRLALQGFVETLPQRGTTVAPIDPRMFHDTLTVLIGMLFYAVREAAPLLTEADKDRLSELRSQLIDYVDGEQDEAQDAVLMQEFYGVYVARYDNRVLSETLDTLYPHVLRGFTAFRTEIGHERIASRVFLGEAAQLALSGDIDEALAAAMASASVIAQAIEAIAEGTAVTSSEGS